MALLKVSGWFFLFNAFRLITGSRLDGAILSTFLMLGTFSILPDKYYLLFGGANPILHNASSSRIIGTFVAVVIVLDLAHSRGERRFIPYWVYALFGAGIAASYLPNTLWIIVIGIVATVFREHYKLRPEPWDERMAAGLILLSVLAMPFLYAFPFNGAMLMGIRTLTIGLIVSLATMLVLKMSVEIILGAIRGDMEFDRSPMYRTAVYSGAAFVALVFLGNVLIPIFGGPASALADFISRLFGDLTTESLYIGKGETFHRFLFTVGDHREMGPWYQAHMSTGHMAAYYGGVMFAALVAVWFFLRHRASGKEIAGVDYVIHGILMLCMAGIPLFLFTMDFVKIVWRQWDLSSFLEVPVYIVLFSSFHVIFRFGRPRELRIARVCLAAFIVIPILATKRLDQYWANFEVLYILLSKSL